MKLKFYWLIAILLIVPVAFSGCGVKDSSKDDTLSDIEKLRAELKKYKPGLESFERFEIEMNACDLLESILSQKDSAGLSGRDLLQELNGFYLKTGETGTTGDLNYRFAEFGDNSTGEPAMIRLYIQYWGKDGKVGLKGIFEGGITGSGSGITGDYRFAVRDGGIYAILVNYMNGEKNKGVDLISYKYAGEEWVDSNAFEDAREPGLSVGDLTEDYDERGWLIDYTKEKRMPLIAYAFSSLYEDNEYEAETVEEGARIYVLKNGERYDGIKLTLTADKWVASELSRLRGR